MTNLFDLTGKKAVVVGGAGGIGQAIAEGLAEAGAQVMISSRKVEALQRAQKEIKDKTGLDILYCAGDASKENEVEALLAAAVKEMGTVDILVNSQGFNKKFPGTEFPVDVWDQLFEANVKSIMLTCKHFGKYFKDNNVHGKIINLSSVRGIRAVGNGGMGNVGYCATKGAVEMLTRAYASDLGPNIQVNAIGPTITYTPMMVGMLPDDETARNNIAAAMPAKRIGYPDDCKGPAIFLASAASDFVTGSTIYPDGGLTNVG
ncbi:2-deoxy-D-gluconate 3-dehydrogenase [Oscillospiraceae bacterium]|nr:2-deoxy-D-gluconate 3-dehydrogenase [Oscillospiraceae bacterium]BDF73420.1 2-deoxy-D-gluconate 3-dehydrogenase [Oscillospiraceae bacterium]